MATSIRLIRRYVWLIDTIRRAGRITLQEINEKWMDDKSLRLESEKKFPERTFHRHRQAIADIFGIDIECDRYGSNTYYIDNEEVLNESSFSSWLFNGLAIDNQLMNNKRLTDRIMFERSPGGSEFLSPIIEAMSQSCTIQLGYRRFDARELNEWLVEPYGLKQSGNRWYMIGRNEGYYNLTVYALDRIESLTVTDNTFETDPQINIDAYFNEVIGINIDDEYDSEKVMLRVYGHQRAYFETLPLHKSQQLIKYKKEYSDYELTLRPEYEFQRAILAMGPNAEILTPLWLREEMKWLAQGILNRYYS